MAFSGSRWYVSGSNNNFDKTFRLEIEKNLEVFKKKTTFFDSAYNYSDLQLLQ